MTPHHARPVVVGEADGSLTRAVYVKPHRCAICGEPIEHVRAGSWRHCNNTRKDTP